MTGVAVRIALEIILVLGHRLPKITHRPDFRDDLAGPQTGRIDVRDRVLGDLFLLVVRVEDCRTIARAEIVALPIERGDGS